MFSLLDVAQAFRIHPNTIRHYIVKGYIKPQKKEIRGKLTYQFSQKDLADVLALLKKRGLIEG